MFVFSFVRTATYAYACLQHLLIVLDMLVKNCGKELHAAVAQESFVATLLDLAGKKIKSRFIKKGEV